MKYLILAGIALLSATAAFAQSSVTINQSSDEQQGNRAVVSQSGTGNSIVINQSSSTIDENSKTSNRKSRPGEGNQVSLRVDANTQTTINQHKRTDGSAGPNSVELWQDGNSSTTINQSSGTHENSVVTHPLPDRTAPRNRAPKRHKRP